METKYTNFDGDWNEPCSYCGRPNLSHQVNAGVHDGITYIHHQPCDEQLQQSQMCAVPLGFVPRLLQRLRTPRVAIRLLQKPAAEKPVTQKPGRRVHQ